MVKAEVISEILSLYKKHGWSLRRVLLSEKLSKSLSASIKILFGDAEIVLSEIDAAWFSRTSGKSNVAWELRHLSETPFAVFELFEKETAEEILREKLLEMEKRLENRLLKSE